MTMVAILFNPITPISLGGNEDIEVIIQLIVPILFLVSIFKLKPNEQK